MRTGILAAFAAAATAMAGMPVAHAAPPSSTDQPCRLVDMADPSPEGGPFNIGVVTAGPVAGNGTLRCDVQVGAQFHPAINNASTWRTGTNGVTVVEPTPVSYSNAAGIVVCSSFADASGTYYYDGASQQWTTSSGVQCQAPADDASGTWARASWSWQPGDTVPTFTPPGADSVPASWSCTTTFPAAGQAHAECEPAPGQEPAGSPSWSWLCLVPAVFTTVLGGSVTSTATCGGFSATCTASAAASAPAPDACSHGVPSNGPVPFVCDVSYTGMTATSAWEARCTTLAPA